MQRDSQRDFGCVFHHILGECTPSNALEAELYGWLQVCSGDQLSLATATDFAVSSQKFDIPKKLVLSPRKAKIGFWGAPQKPHETVPIIADNVTAWA